MFSPSILNRRLRIYVHREILEWVVEYINQNILSKKERATVEEIYHHNFDGQVFLIRFYVKSYSYFAHENIYDLHNLVNRLRYSMPWKAKPTFFLPINSEFEKRKAEIMDELNEKNYCNKLKVARMDVNWLYFTKIEIYEFPDSLSKYQIIEIDSIFRPSDDNQLPIYICYEYWWHQHIDYVDIDTLAMDICVEEWRRYDLLKDFNVQNILELDLANKDYRDPYFNEYLDNYLNILLNRLVPELSSDHDQKFTFDMSTMDIQLSRYFISRFYEKISALLNCPTYEYLRGGLGRSFNCIPLAEMTTEVYLKGDQPSPDKNQYFDSKKAIISNYTNFSGALLKGFVKTSGPDQTYTIRFDTDFIFKYERDEQISPNFVFCHQYKYGPDHCLIKFRLECCTENNVEKLEKFVNYLQNLFNEITLTETVRVTITCVNCVLDDYSFLSNIVAGCITTFQFEQMNFSSLQLQILTNSIAKKKDVRFVNCEGITDTNIMLLLENIDLDNLYIVGKNASTPLIYFLIAEYLMNKWETDTIYCNVKWGQFYFNSDKFEFERFMPLLFYRPIQSDEIYSLTIIEFFKDSDQIVVRNRNSKKIVDFYCLLNNIQEDEPVDPSNNMYMQ